MRKFDLRVFGLAQIVNGTHFRGYFFKEGYGRTSSYAFELTDLEDRNVHLTNDAVQDRNSDYGKYEPGNKISQDDLCSFLAQNGIDYYGKIYPQIKEAVANTLKAFWQRVSTQFRDAAFSLNQFEIFGYDFMIDTDLRVYLIEVNTNPCLSTSPCGLL
jgi:hypothetical protein